MNCPDPLAHPLSVRIHELFGHRFAAMKENLGSRFRMAKFRVYQQSLGSLIGGPGVDLGIEASFPRYVPGTSDNLAFSIDLEGLDREPRICAGMGWGQRDGGGWSEADAHANWNERVPKSFPADWGSSAEWPKATPETIALLERDFERLARGFENCVAYACELLGRL